MLAQHLNKGYQFSAVYVTIAALYLFNFILRRRLVIEKINFLHHAAVQGCKITLIWVVRGCHKVTVEGKYTVPASRRLHEYSLNEHQDRLILCFHGINKRQYRAFRIPQSSVVLSSQFLVHPRTPFYRPFPKLKELVTLAVSRYKVAIARIGMVKEKWRMVRLNFREPMFRDRQVISKSLVPKLMVPEIVFEPFQRENYIQESDI